MFASDDSRNRAFAQDSRVADAQDSSAIANRTALLSAVDWAGDDDGEITTPRLSLTRQRDRFDHEAGVSPDGVPGIGWLP